MSMNKKINKLTKLLYFKKHAISISISKYPLIDFSENEKK
jgi:hypothetical protein